MYFIDHVSYLQGGDVWCWYQAISSLESWSMIGPSIWSSHQATAARGTSHDCNINGTQLAGYQINWDQLYGSHSPVKVIHEFLLFYKINKKLGRRNFLYLRLKEFWTKCISFIFSNAEKKFNHQYPQLLTTKLKLRQ